MLLPGAGGRYVVRASVRAVIRTGVQAFAVVTGTVAHR